MTQIIITGINGFVGRHLVRELKQKNISVIGIGREEEPDKEIAAHLDSYYFQDIAKVWPEIKAQPDAIINLAGLAAVGPSFDHPQDYININSAIVTNMCEYYLRQEKKPRIVSIISGAIYSPDQPMPLTEESDISLNSPYSISKVLNEKQLAYYRLRELDCIAVRPFNHIGPGQLDGFLIPDLIKKIQKSKDDIIEVGNLKTKRDYTDVRDVAKAYRLLATTKKLSYNTYNVCSGKSYSGEEILEKLKKQMNRNTIKTVIDQSKIRPNDPADIYGSAEKLKNDTRWKPTLSLDETIKDIIEN